MKAPNSMRIWFAFVGVILWEGIYFSGFSNVNWLIYVPAAGFSFAALTGICPGLKMFGIKIKETLDNDPIKTLK